MPIVGKKKYLLYLKPENVEYLRSKAGHWYMNKGLSGLVDAYLDQVVKLVKASDRKGKSKLNWVEIIKALNAKYEG